MVVNLAEGAPEEETRAKGIPEAQLHGQATEHREVGRPEGVPEAS